METTITGTIKIHTPTISANICEGNGMDKNMKIIFTTLGVIITVTIMVFIILCIYKIYIIKKQRYQKIQIMNLELSKM